MSGIQGNNFLPLLLKPTPRVPCPIPKTLFIRGWELITIIVFSIPKFFINYSPRKYIVKIGFECRVSDTKFEKSNKIVGPSARLSLNPLHDKESLKLNN